MYEKKKHNFVEKHRMQKNKTMNKRLFFGLTLCCTLHLQAQKQLPQGGADENTPSKSEYFSWINNTNEGATEAQTMANLNFFEWLNRRYGMTLDIYAFDAGAIDGKNRYGSTKSDLFKSQFPNGFAPIAQKAGAMGTRLGIWGGPDGFGETPEEAKERMEMMIGLAKDYNFGLFKMDAVCGQLRPSKYAYFDSMMTEVRKYSPDFVLLNHRLDLGPGTKHSTTFLLGGAETYIDVFMTNNITATHHRAQAISRKAPENLTRLTEDHGVCISSCIDFWEDDLILQSFGRNLILAPEIYGSPWLMRDDEFPTLAFIFNLHRDYRNILPKAIRLPEDQCGPEALSRGDGKTQFVTLRNLTWKPVKYKIQLNTESGLTQKGRKVKARLYHPYIYDLGTHAYGSELEVEVLPFRAALVKLTTEKEKDCIALSGIPYQIINDRAGDVAEVKLLGMPGESYNVKVECNNKRFKKIALNGSLLPNSQQITSGKHTISVSFKGERLNEPWHRKVAEMHETPTPHDAASLYYATVFAGDNNALEARSLKRSGPTQIAEVEAARKAFFQQKVFTEREIWDKNLFDGDLNTGFFASQRWGDARYGSDASFCLNLGRKESLDSIVICVPRAIDHYMSQPLDGTYVSVSADLKNWHSVQGLIGPRMRLDLRKAGAVQYLHFTPCPFRVAEVEGYKDGKLVDRSLWTASNLFRPYGGRDCTVEKTWKGTFQLNEIPQKAYLCVAINGNHGREGAWAAFKINNEYIGCPDRAPSYPTNPWEYRVNNGDKNYTYYLPLTPDMKGKQIEVYAMKLGKNGNSDLKPEIWITAHPIPFDSHELIFKR